MTRQHLTYTIPHNEILLHNDGLATQIRQSENLNCESQNSLNISDTKESLKRSFLRRSSNYKEQYADSHSTWRLEPPPPFKQKTKKHMRPMCTVSFLWFLQNKAYKKVVKYTSASQELHALPTKTFHKFYITSIFCSKTCFSLQA